MAASAHIDTFAARNLPPAEQWPEMIFDKVYFDYPERINCAAAYLDTWVERGEGDQPCLFSPQVTWTYAELQAQVNRICNVLVNQLGFVPGNRVLLRSANNPMMVATYMAVLKAGGVVVATMPLLRAKEIAYPLNKAEISIALCDARLAEDMDKAKEMAPCLQHLVYWGDAGPDSLEARMARESAEFVAVDTAADDICLIAFTSGTTGEPKGTMHNHRDMLVVCDGYAKHVLRAEPSDRFIGSAPFAFTFGLGAVIFPMRIGGSFVVLEKAGPDELPPAIKQFKATIVMTAPTAYRAILGKLDQYNLSSLRKCVSAGEALPKATYDAWLAATGMKLMDGLGGTEMLHIYICAREDEIRPGSTGKALPGYTIAILDDDGKELPRGTLGRLGVRGPLGCRYLADPRQMKYVQHGWNVTGDTFIMDDDGYLWYQARSDDMIISAGYNIAGPEVENALLTHPAVAECGVVGAPDTDRGCIVKAYVLLRPGFSGDDAMRKTLQDHVKAEIAPYKYPRAIDFVEVLPKTQTGKLQRFQLRNAATAEAT